ncbi:protein-tyrosine phosphatase [Agromyces terreus]|uniref:Protein-tyrosine phosphatase n=1 Tax=Agromyces terreus TaxID=424795 RepID=A0A9X2KCK1_9MICO|nr:tyrosine-protein phosphatase [Agromyces terreus]MCP2372533.1 protein-tyrosine phosphatase [Agromyces terreus]
MNATTSDTIVTTGISPGVAIDIQGVPNLRDVGGWSAAGGKVKTGQVYRSAEFSGLNGTAADEFAQLGVRTVYDLRTADERTANANILPTGTEYIVLDILADQPGAGPAQMLQVLSDPKAAEQLLGGGKAVKMFEESYRQFLSLPSAIAGFRQFFMILAEQEHRPGLFHCTTGKDRTGWAAASLLLLLGVSDDDVLADYLLTNDSLVPVLQPTVDKFASIGGDPALLAPVVGVTKEYLEAARAEMEAQFADIETYFSRGLGLSSRTIDSLQNDLVVAS